MLTISALGVLLCLLLVGKVQLTSSVGSLSVEKAMAGTSFAKSATSVSSSSTTPSSSSSSSPTSASYAASSSTATAGSKTINNLGHQFADIDVQGGPYLSVWKILEGVTDPFEWQRKHEPAWKLIKQAGDQKANNGQTLLALHEYGQLMKNPSVFSQMPLEDRYDVFLSMAKILKNMGFHQRSEMLLLEAMSYSKEPFDAHFQLGLLSLDKEDLDKAKVHFKNCLFFKEADVATLVHLTVILLVEGKNFEAKFFVSRILVSLEKRIMASTALQMTRGDRKEPLDMQSLMVRMDHAVLFTWLDSLMSKVFYSEFRVSSMTSAATELFKMFSNLYQWLDEGEFAGRLLFDIGQSLIEKGKPQIARIMMRRGNETSHAEVEGVVSTEIVRIRLSFDYPIAPDSFKEIVECYLNMTSYLSETSQVYNTIDLQNILDTYWPLPLLGWSALPMMPVVNELMWRFQTTFKRTDKVSQHWLKDPNSDSNETSNALKTSFLGAGSNKFSRGVKIELGIFGGHMNSHPIGQVVLRRLLAMQAYKGRTNMRITLIAFPLVPDFITDLIASKSGRVVNLPMDLTTAWKMVEELQLDMILFPDWQPFPDQQSIFFHNHRMAPVQACFFVRGTSCGGSQIDYYIMPSELENSYLRDVPAVEINARVNTTVVGLENEPGRRGSHIVRPFWLERYSEQVVLVDWPIVTPDVILGMFESVVKEIANNNKVDMQSMNQKFSASEIDNDSQSLSDIMSLSFSPLENEGNIFFDGQPVAVLPCFPEYLHPLMDDPIIKIIQAHPTLHLIIVIPEAFFLHVQDSRQKMSWARRLVRRLWRRGGVLFNRIRLLPTPLSDKRLVQLFRQADVILDTFPFGGPLSIHALGLSVGTPIITFANGVVLSTPTSDLMGLREYIDGSAITSGGAGVSGGNAAARKKFEHHPLLRMIRRADIPWKSTTSVLADFYLRYSFGKQLVANNISDFVRLTLTLVDNRESAYSLRVNILDAIDGRYNIPMDTTQMNKNSRSRGAIKCEACIEDIRRFVVSVSSPWAFRRTAVLMEHAAIKHKLEQEEKLKREAKERDALLQQKFRSESAGAPAFGSRGGKTQTQATTRTRRRRKSVPTNTPDWNNDLELDLDVKKMDDDDSDGSDDGDFDHGPEL